MSDGGAGAGGSLAHGGATAEGGTSAGGMAGSAGTSAGVGSAGHGGAAGNGSGGSATIGGSGGTAGVEPYNPCPAAPEPCKIMASGDSITVGAQSTDTGGYRVPLFQTTLEASEHITFVGPSGAGPKTVDGVPFPDAHDGHSGFVIDTLDGHKGLTPLMAGNLTKFTPHIVLLMIGTNDINSAVDVANAPKRLEALIDLVTTTAPKTLLVVAQIIPTRTDSLNTEVRTFNAAIPAMVKSRAQAGKHILTVDMYTAFTANANYKIAWLFDGLHPTDAGYAEMAKVWYAGIHTFLH